MGYRDGLLVLSSSQAVAADADSTYYIDTEVTNPPWKRGRGVSCFIDVEVKTTAGTGVTFEMVHKISEPTHADGVICTAVVLAADLVANATIEVCLPRGMTLLRYIRLYYDITAGTESYTFSAYLGPST